MTKNKTPRHNKYNSIRNLISHLRYDYITGHLTEYYDRVTITKPGDDADDMCGGRICGDSICGEDGGDVKPRVKHMITHHSTLSARSINKGWENMKKYHKHINRRGVRQPAPDMLEG